MGKAQESGAKETMAVLKLDVCGAREECRAEKIRLADRGGLSFPGVPHGPTLFKTRR